MGGSCIGAVHVLWNLFTSQWHCVFAHWCSGMSCSPSSLLPSTRARTPRSHQFVQHVFCHLTFLTQNKLRSDHSTLRQPHHDDIICVDWHTHVQFIQPREKELREEFGCCVAASARMRSATFAAESITVPKEAVTPVGFHHTPTDLSSISSVTPLS